MATALEKIQKYKKTLSNEKEITNNYWLSETKTRGKTALEKIQEYKTLNNDQTISSEIKNTPVNLNKISEDDKILATSYTNNIIKAPENVVTKKYASIPQTNTKYNNDVITEANRNTTQAKAPNLLLTGLNGLIQLGKGTIDKLGWAGDTMLQLGSSKYNPFMHLLYKGDIEGGQNIAKEIIQQDSSKNFIDNVLGYGNVLSNGKTVQESLDEKSLITSDNKAGQILRTVGAQLPSMLIGAGGLGLAGRIGSSLSFGSNAYGRALEEAYNNGATRKEANIYAFSSAGVELLTERIYGGLGSVLKTGAIDDVIARKLTSKMTDKVMKKLTELGIGMIAEGGEETISELINPLLKKMSYMSEEELSKLYKDSNVLESFIDGALSSAVLGGVQLVGNNSSVATNSNELSSNGNIVHDNTNLLENAVKTQNNETSSNLLYSQNANTLPKANYQYTETSNQKINNLNKSIAQYFDDSQQTKNLAQTISKVVEDKNYNVVFDDKIINKNGQTVNAQISSNNGEIEIKINPNSTRAAEFLLNHEITHAIETNSMKKLVMDYASKNADFNQELESLKQTYGTEDVSSEVLADISGQLFGNQEFINNLSMEQPSVFQKFYNKIVELANKITGNSKESLFIQDLKNKWEEAYRNTTTEQAVDNLNNNTVYSIQTDNNGNKYVKVDTNQDIFEGKTLSEQTKIAKKYILDNFRQNGLVVGKEVINVTSKTANEYTHPKTVLNKNDVSSKMRASTELDNLLNIAEYSHSNDDDGRHNIAKDGWDYYKVHFQVGNQYFEGLINIAKADDKKTLYDITKIKKTSRVGLDKKSTTTNAMSSYVNNIPQSNNNVKSDILPKYSMQKTENNASWQKHLENNYKETGTRTNMQDIAIKGTLPKINKTSKSKQPMLPKAKYEKKSSITTVDNSMKVYEDFGRKIAKENGLSVDNTRKWAETAQKSQALDQKLIKEIVNTNDFTYVPESNQKQLEYANNTIENIGYEASLREFNGIFDGNKKVSAKDLMLGQRLLTEASNRGDFQNANDLLMKVTILGTEMGQAIQSLSAIKRLSPQGQLMQLQRSLDRMKRANPKKTKDIKITDEMVEKVLSSKSNKELAENMDLVKNEIAQKLPVKFTEKINAWRYLSMLGNPRTHVRNVVSNIAMAGTTNVKNVVARSLETTADKFGKMIGKDYFKERTKTFKSATKDVKTYVADYVKEIQNEISGISKYSMDSELQKARKIFGEKGLGKFVQTIYDLNSKGLELEDTFFKNRRYKQAMSEYLTANGIETKADIENNPNLVNNASIYAMEESLKATFQQYSALASYLNYMKQNSKVADFALDGLMPFQKTPINIAKTGVYYSPLGLTKTITADSVKLYKGQINPSQYIDNISKGLTGSGIMALGITLAKMGILAGAGDEDKEGKYDEALGTQSYSINIGDKSFTLDWLSPVAMPLFVGVELVENGGNVESTLDFNTATNMLTTTLDPLMSMSFLQGLNNALSGYADNKIESIAVESLKSYTSQFFPTLGGQIAKTIDPTIRSTSVSKDSGFTLGEQILRTNIGKIPGLSYLLEPATDVWGNERKRSDNVIQRAFDNFIAPWNSKSDITSGVDVELKRVYGQTGEDKVIPNAYLKKAITYKGKSYSTNAKEYTQYKKTYGKTAHEYLNKLFSTETYKNSDDETKSELISKVYTYASDKSKQQFLSNKDIIYTNAKKDGEDVYRDNFIVDVINEDISYDSVSYKYQNPTAYLTITQIANYDDYSKYREKVADIKEQYKGEENKTVRKQKIFEYINGLPYNKKQKTILFGLLGGYSLKAYQNDVFDYINSQKISKSEKEEIWKYLYE